MARIAYCAALAIAFLSANLNAIDARVLERALFQAAAVGLVTLALAAAVPFTGLVTERGPVRVIGLRAAMVGLIFAAGALAAVNLTVALRHL